MWMCSEGGLVGGGERGGELLVLVELILMGECSSSCLLSSSSYWIDSNEAADAI